MPEKQLELAQQIVKSLSGDFEPERHHDDYRERVLEMVKRKAKGEKPKKATPANEPKSNVVDLMEALRASLGEKGKKPFSSKRAGLRRASAKRA